MANLPENTSYQSGSSNVSLSNLRKTLQRNPSLIAKKQNSFPSQYMDEKRNIAEIPAGEPLAEQKRLESIPQGYGTFDERFGKPSDSGRIINFGGGQMVTDPTQPNSFFRTERPEYNKEAWIKENTMALGNRSSDLYQVDHIVPLWAGGADTAANKTVLSWNEHNKKTNAQAVPLTLLSHGIIDAKEAQLLAVSWKDRDLQDVPERNEYGMLDIQTAKEVWNKWKNQDKEGTWIKDNKAITGWNYIKEVVKGIPEASKNTGDYMVPDFVPGHKSLEALGQGFASGLTGGFIPGVSEEAPLHEKLFGMAGSFAGMLIPVSKFAKLAGVESRVASKVATEGLAKAGIKVAEKTGSKMVGDGIYRRVLNKASKSGSEAFKRAASNNAIAYAKAFTLYGQLSREGALGFGMEKLGVAEEGQARPVGRLIEDMVYGVATGVIPPNLKGAIGMATLPILIGGMSQPFRDEFNENWLEEALIMSAVMGSLHMIAGSSNPEFTNKPGHADIKRFVKEYEKDKYILEGENALNTLETYTGPIGKNFRDAEGKLLPEGHEAFSEENVEDFVLKAKEKLWDYAASGKETVEADGRRTITELSPAELEAAWEEIIFAGRGLFKRGLSREERANADIADFGSIIERTKKMNEMKDRKSVWDEVPGNFGVSGKAKTAVDSLDDDLLRKGLGNSDRVPQSGENLTGIGRATGYSSDLNSITNKNAITFIEAADGKNPTFEASPLLVVVDRSETAPFWRRLSQKYKEMIAKGQTNENRLQKPFEHPENALEIYGVLYNKKTGERSPVSIGWIPREAHVEGEYKNAFNNQPEVKMDPERFPPLDPRINKDPLSDEMKKNGLPVLFVNYLPSKSGTAAIKSQQPFIHFSINDANWNTTLQKVKSLETTNRPVGEVSPMSSNIKEVREGLQKKKVASKVVKTTRAINNRIDEPADVVLDRVLQSSDGEQLPTEITYVQDLLRQLREAIGGAKTIPDLQKALHDIDININKNKAVMLMNQRDEMTVQNAIDFVSKAVKNEETGLALTYLFTNNFKKGINSTVFKKWAIKEEEGFHFGELKLLGGLKTGKKTTSIGATQKPVETMKLPLKEDLQPQTSNTPLTKETPRTEPSSSPTAIPGKTVKTTAQPSGDLATKIAQKVSNKSPKTGGDIASKITSSFSKKPQLTDRELRSQISEKENLIKQPSEVTTTRMEKIAPRDPVATGARRSHILQIINNTVDATKQKMEEIKVSKAGGEESQTMALMSIMRNLQPEFPLGAPSGKDIIGKLTSTERDFILSEARRELNPLFAEVLKVDSVAKKELFDLGVSTDNELYDAALSLKIAQKLSSTGNKNAVFETEEILKESLGKNDLLRVKKLIGDESYKAGGPNIKYSKEELKEQIIESGKKKKLSELKGTLKEYEDTNNNEKSAYLKEEITKIIEEGRKEDYLVRSLVSEKNIGDFIDKPKSLTRGNYMREFSEVLDYAMPKAWGENWRENPILMTIFSSVSKNTDNYGRKYTFFDDLGASTDTNKTQPTSILKSWAKGMPERAKEDAAERKRIIESMRGTQRSGDWNAEGRNLTKDKSSGEIFGIDKAEEGGFKLQTEAQRDDTNVDITSPLDSILAGVTLASREGTTPTAQSAIADATRFVEKVREKYSDIRSSILKNQVAKDMKNGKEVRKNPKVPKYKKGDSYSNFTVEDGFFELPEVRYNILKKYIKEATDDAIRTLSGKKIAIGSNVDDKTILMRDALDAHKKVKEIQAEGEQLIRESLFPQFTYLAKNKQLPHYKNLESLTPKGGNLHTPTIEKVKYWGGVLIAKEKNGEDISKPNMKFLADFKKFQKLSAIKEENQRAKDIAKSDRSIYYGTLK